MKYKIKFYSWFNFHNGNIVVGGNKNHEAEDGSKEWIEELTKR